MAGDRLTMIAPCCLAVTRTLWCHDVWCMSVCRVVSDGAANRNILLPFLLLCVCVCASFCLACARVCHSRPRTRRAMAVQAPEGMWRQQPGPLRLIHTHSDMGRVRGA